MVIKRRTISASSLRDGMLLISKMENQQSHQMSGIFCTRFHSMRVVISSRLIKMSNLSQYL